MEKEFRNYSIEFKSNPETRLIEGRAIPFNIQSPNREGFREMIKPEAVEGVFENSDIFMLYNHDNSKGFLARNNKGKGSLNIEVREDGVWFSFTAKQDDLSNYVFERLANGELDETSWAFTVAEETWEKQEDGTYNRTITKFERLYDFSIVDQSYYGISEAVGCKRFAEIQEQDRLETERKLQELKEAEERALEEKYSQLMEEYKNYLPE